MKPAGRPGALRAAGIAMCVTLLTAAPAPAQIEITETVAPTFGLVMGGPPNRRFVLDTNDTISGPDAADYMFGAGSGELIFQRRGGPTLVYFVAENISTTGGVAANRILCKWHNTPEGACDGVGMLRIAVGRRRLLLGVDMTTTQFHGGGDRASVSFDITATFL
jgi:hypothetical protein